MKIIKVLTAVLFLMTGLLVMFTGCDTPLPDNGCGDPTGTIGAKYAAGGPYSAATTSITGYSIYF